MNNIELMCRECAEKRKSDFQEKLLDNESAFIKALVDSINSPYKVYAKVSFSDEYDTEHMWMLVNFYHADTKKITGTLSNEPLYLKNIQYGDIVSKSIYDMQDVIMHKEY
jgi:uncharacterized protein YegJ (DUF2314 family)